MNQFKFYLLGTMFLVLTLASCTDDGSGNDTPSIVDGIIELDVSNLPDSGDDFDYYMWLVSGGVNIRLGSFEVENGLPSQTLWQLGDLNILENASNILVSMSPEGIEPTSPDKMVMLSGDFGSLTENSGSLSTAPMSTEGNGFSGSTGEYLLATPTTSTMSEERSGIWFGNNSTGSVEPGLNLPTLTDGWVYQGWVNLGSGLVLRTGKFYQADSSDLEKIYGGSLDGFNVPGEDFNQNLPMMGNPPTLSGNEVWLTVQPDTLTDELFPLPIFRDTIGVAEATTYTLPNVFPDFAGTVSRR